MPRRQLIFFQDLFQYRQRERHAPLENFLTSALTGFARALPRRLQIEFAADLFVAQSQREMFVKLFSRASDLRWDAQFTLENNKRPDMVLWVDGKPAIVIENKIGSGIAVHRHSITDADDAVPDENHTETTNLPFEEISQLKTYGRWLRGARVGTEWVGSLVLLTHDTPPPGDFSELTDAYGAFPHTCYWSAVLSWLKRFPCFEQMQAGEYRSAPAFLASELAAFIEEKGLIMPALKFSDIDVLGSHLASRAALSAAFHEVLATVNVTSGDLVRPEGARAIKYAHADGVVQGWVYLEMDQLPEDTFFTWGLRFPDVSSWWEELRDQLPAENHVFACLGNEDENFPAEDIPISVRPPGWKVCSEGVELIAAAPLSALPAAETLSRALALWVSGQLEALRPALNQIVEH